MSTQREIHDFSEITKFYETSVSRATADKRLKTGAGVLAGALGVASVVAAASLWMKPEIVHDVKVTEKVVFVDKPVITEKVVYVDRPVVTEKVVNAPAPVNEPKPFTPPPQPGQQMTKDQFQNTQMFKTARKCNGKLVSHIQGVMLFEDGSTCMDANPDGTRDTSLTTTRHNGDMMTCNATGRNFPNGAPEWTCYALHNGRIEKMSDFRTASNHERQPLRSDVDPQFRDLF